MRVSGVTKYPFRRCYSRPGCRGPRRRSSAPLEPAAFFSPCSRPASGSALSSAGRALRRLYALRARELMLGHLFSTPRAEPNHVLPGAGGTLVLLLLLPVVALLGWSIVGWGLAAVLWLGLHALDLVLARVRHAGSAMQAFGLFFKLITILVILFAALAADRDVALVAVLTYGLAYTFELGLSLVSYFGAPSA